MEYTEEIWKDIEGFEGRYQVSNLGNVKSLERVLHTRNNGVEGTRHMKEMLLKQYDCLGYLKVKLYWDNKNGKFYRVHRLVAKAFIPNPSNLPVVNHRDENTKNNVVSNLEWCTNEYNQAYGTRTERTQKKVNQFTINGELVKEWKSLTSTREAGFDPTNVGRCCKGKRQTYKGYKWSYQR